MRSGSSLSLQGSPIASTRISRCPSASYRNENDVVSPAAASETGRPSAASRRRYDCRSGSPHFATTIASWWSARSARAAYHGPAADAVGAAADDVTR